MATTSELKIKLSVLTDGVKQKLGDAKQGFDALKAAASGKTSGITEDLTEKLKLAESEIKKAIEDLIKLKQAANGKTGALADSLAQEIGKAEAKIKSAEAQVDKLKAKLNSGTGGGLSASATKDLNDIGKSTGALGSTVDRTMGDIKSTIASAFAVGALIAFTHKLVETVQQIQDLRIRLSGLTTSANDYAASEAYLIDLAGRHHKSVNDLTASYASMLTLERSGIITRQQSMQLLEGFSNLASKTGASNVQMAQSLYGLSQALGTGVVNMQDFRQIVEPMPGLANEIAKAMDMTVGQLREKIASGTLASEEFGKHIVAAMQTYDGAAQRSAGTISATYNDVSNAYIEMAKELEKPIASGVLGVAEVAKKSYRAISDNGDSIIGVITAVAVVMAGKGVAGIAAYAKAGIDSIAIEKAHGAALVENAQRRVAAKESYLVSAKAKLADTLETTRNTRANYDSVASQTANAKAVELNAKSRLASLRTMYGSTLGAEVEAKAVNAVTLAENEATIATERLALAQTALTSAVGKQSAAQRVVTASTISQIAAQEALNGVTAQSSVLMTRLGTAAKSAMAFVGGPVGVAVIALYGLYEILNKINDTEAKAEAKAKATAKSLEEINEAVKKMSAQEVTLNMDKAKADADELKAKISTLEKFNFKNFKDAALSLSTLFVAPSVAVNKFVGLLKTAGIRQVLKDDLSLVEEKLKALNEQDIELIKNFDATLVPVKDLPAVLENATKNASLFAADMERLNTKLHETGGLSLYEQKQLNEDKLRLNAWEAEESALKKQLELSSDNHYSAEGKKSKAAAKARLKDVEDEIKEVTGAKEAERAQQAQAIQASLTQRKADIALTGMSEVQKEKLVTQATKAAQDAQLLMAQEASAARIKAIDDVFNAKLGAEEKGVRLVKQGSTEEANLNKESLQMKLTAYNQQAKSYGDMINDLVAEELRLTRETKTLADERKGIEQSYEDFKRSLHQLELTDAQKTSEDLARLNKLSSDRDRALKDGDFKKAQELDAKILESGKTLALAEKQKAEEAKKSGKAYSDSVSEIVRLTDKAQANILKSNTDAQGAVKDRLDETKASADAAKTELENTQAKIKAITETLQQKFDFKIEPDAQAVYDAIDRISKPTESKHTIHIVEVKDGGGDAPAPIKKAGGGYIALNAYAGGGEVLPPQLFPRKQGAISGKGTGTSDEVPAMLSNGEYVLTAKTTARLGKTLLDDANYGNADLVSVKAYATGGAVGADKVDELKNKKYEEVKTFFSMPNTQVAWSYNFSNQPIASDDIARQHFEQNADKYLREQGLPLEFLTRYMKELTLAKALQNAVGFGAKAKAQVAIDDFNAPKTAPPVPVTTPTPVVSPSVALPPVMPLPESANGASRYPIIAPPSIPRQDLASSSHAVGKTTTVKFENAQGETVTGYSTDQDFDKFFSELEAIQGVTKK